MANRASPRSLTEAELAEAKDLDRRLCEAFGRKDLDAAMACFWDSPDLVVVLYGQVQLGPAEVREGIRKMFEQNESIKVEVKDITYVRSGDGVIGVGLATFHLQSPGGRRQLVVERWSDLRRKVDGRWVYVLDHATVVPGAFPATLPLGHSIQAAEKPADISPGTLVRREA
jgi:uncharacterized protein (TIGR02246 family)